MASVREFEFHECLGRGGFAEVYRATMHDGADQTEVAVKLLHKDAETRHQGIERLRDEARILGMIHHPVVPRTWGITKVGGRLGMVVEYIDGVDLNQMRKVDARIGVCVLERVASALHSAWVTVVNGQPVRVVHRDVKPSNIRLGRAGVVKLLDFGIARMELDEREAKTGTGELVGSVPYLAPERLLEGASRPGQDIYALGATVFELLFERRLFSSSLERVYGILADPDRFQEHLDEHFAVIDADPQVETLLRRMLSHDEWDRPDGHRVSCEAQRILTRMGGSGLEAFCAKFPFDERHQASGPFTGRRIAEEAHGRRPARTTDQGEATVLYDTKRARPLSESPASSLAQVAPKPWSVGGFVARQPLIALALLCVFLSFLGGVGALVFGVVFAVL